ncbi:MAG: hypothetical protein K6F46_02975 [Desulfovibrio sp.]|nr:hypothetical protein [Desulfovibrio sp.]
MNQEEAARQSDHINKIYFDKQDRSILAMVNRIIDLGSVRDDPLLDTSLHPHGIKELVASPVERMAFAVVNLLRNLEGHSRPAEDRLTAFQALYDEVLNSAHSALRRNTARVLMQIMKELIRAHGGDRLTQLKLAHDFRNVVHGTPRIVRRMLARYYLPEMPEEWNQIAFDDHVYDVNTKGRKTPTHLIMDAWIKGLRSLTVAYEYCLDPEAAREVLRAAEIAGIEVRIGLDFQVPFYDRYVHLFWIPRGFTSNDDFLAFLHQSRLTKLMERGREVLEWRRNCVLRAMRTWNETQRKPLAEAWGEPIGELTEEEFMQYIGVHQASMSRLAECLHRHVLPAMKRRAAKLLTMDSEEAYAELEALEELGPATIYENWLSPAKHPDMPDMDDPASVPEDAPEIMRLSAAELTRELLSVSGGHRLVLNTTGLSVEDVAEILWDCQGAVTHLEIFNMKGWMQGEMTDMKAISDLQQALSQGLGPRIKKMLRAMIEHLESEGDEKRAAKFRSILRDVPALWEYYRNSPLKTRLGTSSASQLSFGMGLVLMETLPRRAVAELKKYQKAQRPIPLHSDVSEHVIYSPPESPSLWQKIGRKLSFLPGCRHLGLEKRLKWELTSDDVRVCEKGNVASLGGLNSFRGNGFLKENVQKKAKGPGLIYLNTTLLNCLKVLTGFLPAFICFNYTQSWWLLAWGGAFIWFGITGVRNVIQMVLAARGASKGTLVHWTSQIAVPRLCDSLMYTGFSVLLLEVLVRTFFLQNTLGWTVANRPLGVFTVLSCVNGLYIFSHNLFRGFPKTAAVGNLFRNVLGIPVADFYNFVLFNLLALLGVQDIEYYLVPAASIISKTASDTVACVIEGYADSRVNLRMRAWDYKSKVKHLFACYTRLEMLFPQEDALVRMSRTGGLSQSDKPEVRELERAFIVDALDMMYFWYYQPRAQEALKGLLSTMSEADCNVLMRSQLVLTREREISQMLVDGLLGRNFAQPLELFLAKHKQYVHLFILLCRKRRTLAREA